MADERGGQDLMGYEAMAQDALRGVVRSALRRAASPGGIPGEHHFYITFLTKAPGVSVPADLAERFPKEMTIVLQHQFWDLKPGADGFSVMLKFGGEPKVLQAPYAAVTRFYDPSVQFMLQFEPSTEDAAEAPSPAPRPLRPRLAEAPKPKRADAETRTTPPAKAPTRLTTPRDAPSGDPKGGGDARKGPDKPNSAASSRGDGPKGDGPKGDGPKGDGPKIVSLDTFRKK